MVPIENGRDYLQKHHNDASGGVADMLEQMRTTVAGAFERGPEHREFADGAAQGDFEQRLDAADHAIDSAAERIPLLKGSCTRIGEIAEAGPSLRRALFWAIFGKSARQRQG